MCGIAGFTTFRSAREDAQEVLARMTRALAHRGPDGEGFYTDPFIGLGHRRLSIIDAAGGAQPMATPDRRFHLAFNGEIYNFVELRRELEAQGETFRTASDTEVLLRLLALEGTGALDRLDGMFALAFWDRHEERLLLARDRLGEKPIFFTVARGELVFASELKAVLLHPAVDARVSPAAVDKYLAFGYVPAPHTIFDGISAVTPGETITFTARGCERKAWWRLPLSDTPVGAEAADAMAERLEALLSSSVRRRLRSDVPVGVFLSGGVDSSAVTALAVRHAGAKLKTFSIGFPERSYDESPFAHEVARRFGTDHHHDVLTMDHAARILPEALATMDGPFGDASIVPTYFLAKLARRHVKTVLGGDGGDELFAGYPSFLAHRIVEALSFLPVPLRDALNGILRRVPVSARYNSAGHLLHQFLKGAGIGPEIRFLLWMGCCGHATRNALLHPDLKQALAPRDPFDEVRDHVLRSSLQDGFQRVTCLALKMYLPDDILTKVDRASMAHGLEVRSPFLDHHLVAHACAVPPSRKLRGFRSKAILKRAFKGALPDAILHRRKAGFMFPVAAGLRGAFRPMLEDACSESAVRRSGILEPKAVTRLMDDHLSGRRDHRRELWAVLCLQLWLATPHPRVRPPAEASLISLYSNASTA
jgi:asparagine synthase (glutamine-hydrolysing)